MGGGSARSIDKKQRRGEESKTKKQDEPLSKAASTLLERIQAAKKQYDEETSAPSVNIAGDILARLTDQKSLTASGDTDIVPLLQKFNEHEVIACLKHVGSQHTLSTLKHKNIIHYLYDVPFFTTGAIDCVSVWLYAALWVHLLNTPDLKTVAVSIKVFVQLLILVRLLAGGYYCSRVFRVMCICMVFDMHTVMIQNPWSNLFSGCASFVLACFMVYHPWTCAWFEFRPSKKPLLLSAAMKRLDTFIIKDTRAGCHSVDTYVIPDSNSSTGKSRITIMTA